MTREQNNTHMCIVGRSQSNILTVRKTNMYDALGTSVIIVSRVKISNFIGYHSPSSKEKYKK